MWKTLAAVLVAALWVKAVTIALSLMDESSDAGVLTGLLLLAGCALLALRVVVASGALSWARREFGRYLGVAALLLVSTVLSGCAGCTVVSPGTVGIKVNMVGGNRGVSDLPIVTGWVFFNPLTQRVFEYPTFVQTAVWTRSQHEGGCDNGGGPENEEVSFNTKEGLIVSGDISLSYQLAAEKVPAFYVKFRSDDLCQFTHGFLRNVARDQFNEVAGTYAVEEIYGPKKEEFLGKVRERINMQVEPVGVSLQQFGFIGAPRPPQQVIDAINAKITATQLAMQRENELRQTKAEADKNVAKATGDAASQIARAKGEAEANRSLAASITPDLIEWRRLDLQQRAIEKWNGARPMIEGESSGGLFLQMPAPKLSE